MKLTQRNYTMKRNFFRISVMLCITAYLLVIPAVNVRSQIPTIVAGATIGALIHQAEELIQKLENAGATLGGNGSKLVDGTVGQLTTLINQLKDLVRNDLSLQLDKLSGTALEVSRRLKDGVERMDELVNVDMAC